MSARSATAPNLSATGPAAAASATQSAATAKSGAIAATVCYLLWGAFPLYWKQLHALPAEELIAHRYVWTCVMVVGLMLVRGRLAEVRAALGTVRGFATNTFSAALLTGNWLVYVWGVNHDRVLETSLGYFLVPLVNVAAGRFLLGEHLRRVQWLAIACAATGVALMIFNLGHPPWIALILAGTWGGYGIMRKRSPLPALTGLTVETLLVVPFALAFLAIRYRAGAGAFPHISTGTQALLLASGVVTAIPLVLFAYGAKRLRLTTLGLLQYLAPSVQFILGVAVYHEAFTSADAVRFGFIWTALALYTADNLWAQSRR